MTREGPGPRASGLGQNFVLAGAGALAIHVILAVVADALVVMHPLAQPPRAPRLAIVDVQVVKPRVAPRPAPAPVTVPRQQTQAPRPVAAMHSQVARISAHAAAHPGPEPISAPGPATPAPAAPGGGDGPILQMDDVGVGATAVGPGSGSGRGSGSGTGTGTGTGTGMGAGPVSVADIKTRAMPRGDYSYYESKDYPPEARRLGIEGPLRVRLVVDERGKVTSATLLDHLGHGLDELALARARAIEFTPARDAEDRPVASVVIWTFQMTLPR